LLSDAPRGSRERQRIEEGKEGVIDDEDPNTGDDFDDTWLFIVA